MKKAIVILSIIGVTFTIICIWFVYFFNLAGDCGIEIKKESLSDDGKYIAKVQVVNCGATTDFVTWIIIKDIQNNKEQRMIVIKGDHSGDCELNWDQPRMLRTYCGVSVNDVSSYNSSFEDVHLLYSPN